MNFHLHQWISLSEARQNPRQKPHHVVVRRANFHHADHVRLAQGVEHFAVQFEDTSGVTEQHLALDCEADGAAVFLKE